jgi:hypothetical protein
MVEPDPVYPTINMRVVVVGWRVRVSESVRGFLRVVKSSDVELTAEHTSLFSLIFTKNHFLFSSYSLAAVSI